MQGGLDLNFVLPVTSWETLGKLFHLLECECPYLDFFNISLNVCLRAIWGGCFPPRGRRSTGVILITDSPAEMEGDD